MEDRKEKILKIREKIQNYNKFISEYGFNPDKDIFIKEDINDILNELSNIEKEINDEK
jgi:hypothetical protein